MKRTWGAVGERQVRSVKVFLRDSGLLHSLLGIDSFGVLEGRPKLGASWEGFALEDVLRSTGDREACFWSTASDAAQDLLVFLRGKRIGFEFKYADAPVVTRSLKTAYQDLKLDRVFIVHPGSQSYPLNEWAEVVGIGQLHLVLKGLRALPAGRGKGRQFG